MTCGCGQTPNTFPVEQSANAVMCHWCLWSEKVPGEKRQWTAVSCTISRMPVETHIATGQCPKGKYPVNGVARACGLRWYGVPAPYRWLLSGLRDLPGCGCIVMAKTAWNWLRPRLGACILNLLWLTAATTPLVVAALEVFNAD